MAFRTKSPPNKEAVEDVVEDDDEADDDEADDRADDEADDESREQDERPAPPRARARTDPQTRARGSGGMGRPSTGPPLRPPASRQVVSEETELAPNIESWPGTAEAARMVGRHTSTIKLWRSQGRIRALQDGSGCWRYHPDDLAEAIDTPDGTDPGSVLAQGMTAIVSQGASANERLLAMTEIATVGLKDATSVLSLELKRAYAHIDLIETKLTELREKQSADRGEELKHERYVRRIDHQHELELVTTKETSARLQGLLTVLGPIAASIGKRLIGDEAGAERLESKVGGIEPPGESMPIETRIAAAMARLCDIIRRLDGPAFDGLRALMPASVAAALDAVKKAENDASVGKALAIIVQAAQNLSDLQFTALRPITPADIAAVLAELRTLVRSDTPPANGGNPS